jgi:hypothetical protein
MNENRIATLLELIAEAVQGDGTWREKAQAILAEATESDKTNLQEFATWFDPEEMED